MKRIVVLLLAVAVTATGFRTASAQQPAVPARYELVRAQRRAGCLPDRRMRLDLTLFLPVIRTEHDRPDPICRLASHERAPFASILTDVDAVAQDEIVGAQHGLVHGRALRVPCGNLEAPREVAPAGISNKRETGRSQRGGNGAPRPGRHLAERDTVVAALGEVVPCPSRTNAIAERAVREPLAELAPPPTIL